VKVGGNAMGEAASMARFARDIVLMKQCGVNPVVVHGGGPQINQMLERLAIKSEFKDGLRVTTAETVEVVEMVLAGAINKRIVGAINSQGGQAAGLCGKDANLMICEKALKTTKDPDSNIEKVLDLGFVGEPVEVNPRVLRTLLAADFIPVVAPVGAGRKPGETFNVNGDTAAGAIAGAMKAERLMLLTDVQGVKNRDGAVLTELTAADVAALIADGTIAGGMIPKAQTALHAMEQGCGGAVILDGTTPHGLLLELFTKHGAGTLILG
jgi:acetylglutamate kinase